MRRAFPGNIGAMEMGEHIYLIQPDARVRSAWFHLLSAHPDRIVRGFGVAADFIEQAGELAGGCVLIDWSRTDPVDACDVLAVITQRADLVIFVVAAQLSLTEMRSLLRAGARDLFRLPINPDDVRSGIDAGFAELRRIWNNQKECAAARARLARLTARERAILASITEGLTNKAVARRFDLSPRTVEVHRANMLRRAETANFAELFRLQFLAEQAVTPHHPMVVPGIRDRRLMNQGGSKISIAV